jgi:hypothetical protein
MNIMIAISLKCRGNWSVKALDVNWPTRPGDACRWINLGHGPEYGIKIWRIFAINWIGERNDTVK